MADEIIKKLLGLSASGSSSRHQRNETQEDMFRRILAETIASKEQPSQSQAGAAGPAQTGPDVIQNLLKVMNFQVDHAMAEKSELAVEKTRRLQAEQEAEELKRQLAEMKTKDNPDKKKVDGMERKLHELEEERTQSENNDDIQKLIQLLASLKGSNAESAENLKPDKNGGMNKFGKCEPLPDWFPGSSKSNDSVNNSSDFPKEKLFDKDVFNSATAPPYGHQQNFAGNHGPFPPNQMPPPYMNVPPQYGNMNNFQRPQFPFGGDYNNMQIPPLMGQQFHGQMPMNQGFNPRQTQQFPGNQQGFMQRPNFTQGPDQVKFTQNPHPNQQQPKNKAKKQNTPKQQAPQPKQQAPQPQQKNQPKKNNNEKPPNQPSEPASDKGQGEPAKKTRSQKKKAKQQDEAGNAASNLNQPQKTNNSESVNLSKEDIQHVKEACSKKKTEEQGNKTAFKKKKNPKPNQQNENAGDNDDSDSSDANVPKSDAKKAPKSEAQKAPKPAPQPKGSQNTGGAKKKDNSSSVPGQETTPKKKNKNKNPDNQPKASGNNDLNLFVGEQFPTMKDVQSGKLTLTQEVKDILMLAKVDTETITETPKTVQDMILFHHKYPNAKLIVLR